MNKRARMRLIGVTAIIVIVIGVLLATQGQAGLYSSATVSDAVGDAELVGERVRVTGTVIGESYDPTVMPVEFDIKDEVVEEGEESGAILRVVYSGSVPPTFGDGIIAILTGTIEADGVLKADEMVTKCPSKYQSAEGAETPTSLLASPEEMVGKQTKLAGAVVSGSIVGVGEGDRFSVHSAGAEMPVLWDGVLPEGMEDESSVVISGSLTEDGKFLATDVALEGLETPSEDMPVWQIGLIMAVAVVVLGGGLLFLAMRKSPSKDDSQGEDAEA